MCNVTHAFAELACISPIALHEAIQHGDIFVIEVAAGGRDDLPIVVLSELAHLGWSMALVILHTLGAGVCGANSRVVMLQ